MQDISVTCEVSKEERSREASDEQPENMPPLTHVIKSKLYTEYIDITLEVSKEERSREASDEQPENMPPMPVTLEVSREDRSREVSDEQPRNIDPAFEICNLFGSANRIVSSAEQL